MVQVGKFNTLTVNRKVEFGYYLNNDAEGILLPKRFAPANLRIGDDIRVFVYHDSDNRLIATTQDPKGVVGDIVRLKAVSITHQGAFLDWGLMKDLFVPVSKQHSLMKVGGEYLVKIYLDEQTGRVAATEKVEALLHNDTLTVKEMDAVQLLIYRKSEIGYVVIINNIHIGMLHNNQVFKPLRIGNKYDGFIKTIRPDGKIDVVLGKAGFAKAEDEAATILRLLAENEGFLPYHDKTAPEIIYDVFGMSKKTFKMTLGTLYKQRKVAITAEGITLAVDDL